MRCYSKKVAHDNAEYRPPYALTTSATTSPPRVSPRRRAPPAHAVANSPPISPGLKIRKQSALAENPSSQLQDAEEPLAAADTDDLSSEIFQLRKEIFRATRILNDFAALEQTANSCPRCDKVSWQPLVLSCGHDICTPCLLELQKKCMRTQHRRIKCPVTSCQSVILRPPIICFDLQDRVHTMAQDLGLTIPEPLHPTWTVFPEPPY
ncbi:hypothetical protein BDZ89DRAFT_1131425 [Hymenopellis radicata]|nr:hypothetical protein BDZ89DRAFT_1131425 [Hymenopellis radicata]